MVPLLVSPGCLSPRTELSPALESHSETNCRSGKYPLAFDAFPRRLLGLGKPEITVCAVDETPADCIRSGRGWRSKATGNVKPLVWQTGYVVFMWKGVIERTWCI